MQDNFALCFTNFISDFARAHSRTIITSVGSQHAVGVKKQYGNYPNEGYLLLSFLLLNHLPYPLHLANHASAERRDPRLSEAI
jgi:hypothetical protein